MDQILLSMSQTLKVDGHLGYAVGRLFVCLDFVDQRRKVDIC